MESIESVAFTWIGSDGFGHGQCVQSSMAPAVGEVVTLTVGNSVVMGKVLARRWDLRQIGGTEVWQVICRLELLKSPMGEGTGGT